MKVIKVLVLFSFLLCLFAENADAKDGFFIHLSSKDQHRVSMALTFALKMSTEHDVMIFADIDGVYPLLKDAENYQFKNFEPKLTVLNKLIEAGVQIAVCPMCLETAGYTKYHLVDGIKIVDKKDLFGFTEGRIITLDY